MQRIKIVPTLAKYKLDSEELACILLYSQSGDKTFSWSNTVGKGSKSKNQNVLAYQWFRQEKAQRFFYEHNELNPEVDKEDENRIDSDLIKEVDSRKNKKEEPIDKTEISSDNIKELLEREYQKTTDPEKRTVLLIKIAEFIGLKNNDDDDPLTPVIYLPKRCTNCEFRLNTKE